jgi:hypothetical protein
MTPKSPKRNIVLAASLHVDRLARLHGSIATKS